MKSQRHLGRNIVIDPFDEAQLNPNSYNLTLHDELMTYEEVVLDMRQAEPRAADANSARRTGAQPAASFIWAARSSGPKRTTSCR